MMKFFDPEFIGAEKTDHTIYMDIDMDWNAPPNSLIHYQVGHREIVGIHRFTEQNLELKDKCPFHDSFIKFKSHELKFIHDRYFLYHEYYQTKILQKWNCCKTKIWSTKLYLGNYTRNEYKDCIFTI